MPGQPPAPKRGSALPWVIGGGVLVLALVGGAVFLGFQVGGGSNLGDVQTFDDLSKDHVEIGTTVDYDQHPPVGGEHYAFWQNCGVYDEPVLTEAAVHSLEHGAVWVTHDPDLDPDQVESLAAYAEPGSYVIVSPMEDLPAPVVASAWGAQLQMDELDDASLAAFLREYEQSPDAPEPGAPCSGKYGGTQAEFDAEGAEGVDARDF